MLLILLKSRQNVLICDVCRYIVFYDKSTRRIGNSVFVTCHNFVLSCSLKQGKYWKDKTHHLLEFYNDWSIKLELKHIITKYELFYFWLSGKYFVG